MAVDRWIRGTRKSGCGLVRAQDSSRRQDRQHRLLDRRHNGLMQHHDSILRPDVVSFVKKTTYEEVRFVRFI